jgi:hypothetical protein
MTDHHETKFLELIGAITVAILVFSFIYWIGWIFIYVIFWGAFIIGATYLVKDYTLKKDFKSLLYALGLVTFSSFGFLFVATYSSFLMGHLVTSLLGYIFGTMLLLLTICKLAKTSNSN